MDWNAVSPFLAIIGLAMTAGAVVIPFLIGSDRKVKMAQMVATAETQAFRISALEGQRDDAKTEAADLTIRVQVLEEKNRDLAKIIERGMRHE